MYKNENQAKTNQQKHKQANKNKTKQRQQCFAHKNF